MDKLASQHWDGLAKELEKAAAAMRSGMGDVGAQDRLNGGADALDRAAGRVRNLGNDVTPDRPSESTYWSEAINALNSAGDSLSAIGSPNPDEIRTQAREAGAMLKQAATKLRNAISSDLFPNVD